MKALRFYAPEDVRLEDVPEPTCGPDEVKLRVRNCSTCGTDVKIFYNGHQNLTYGKPAKSGARTNLNLITASGNVYSFVLTEVSDQRGHDPDLKVYVELTEPSMVAEVSALAPVRPPQSPISPGSPTR